jgi:modulator of FtsH protease HflC
MRAMVPLLAAIFVVVVLGLSSLFTVDQTDQALVTQFGQPIKVIQDPGLHAKVPFVQTVIDFDRRLLDLNVPSEEVILGDQRRLIVDSFARYRIVNPLQYYQAVGATEAGIQGRLISVVSSALRRVLGNETLLNVLSAQRGRIMATIRDQVNHEMQGFGVSVDDVRIRRADLPPENTQAILARMQSERQRVAAQARAEGVEAATKIRADADRERTVLLAEAQATSDNLRGEGEAQATQIYAKAAERDPQFYGTWRTLQAYRDVFTSGRDRLVLSPDSDFLRLLTQMPTQSPSAATAAPDMPTPKP